MDAVEAAHLDAMVRRASDLEAEVRRLRGDRDVQRAWAVDYKSQRDEAHAENERLQRVISEASTPVIELRRENERLRDQVKELRDVRDVAVEELPRLTLEVERLRAALKRIAHSPFEEAKISVVAIARQALGAS